MKKLINISLQKLLFLPLIVLMTFTSCQNEVTDITDPNEQETLIANSTLANLLQNTTLRDGSFDNIIDSANCISVNLPVTVIVNGLEITIDSEEDFAVIEVIFDEFNDDDDILEIIFPITIILNDYTEVTINNLEELEQFVEECNGENEEDDDIECIDFQYPISISVYDSDFQVIDTVEINDDEELHDFIEDLDGGVLASINFPVTLIKADGTTVVVNNNDELQAAIEAAEDTCDEDDDNDCDDDDNNDIPIEDLTHLLINCSWTVDELEVNNQNLEDQYEGYVFTFYSNGTVKADINGNFDEGTWELIQTDTVIKLNLQMTNLTDFNNESWILHEIEDGNDFELEFRHGEDELEFKKHACDNNPTDCSEEQVDSYLIECVWNAVNYNGIDDFSDWDLEFNVDGSFTITNPNGSTTAHWSTSGSTNGVIIDFFDIEGSNDMQGMNGSWSVIQCAEDRIKVENNNGDYIIFEQDCENNDPCTETDVDAYLMECTWFVVNNNGSDNLADFSLDFNANDDILITDLVDNQTYSGFWATSTTANGVMVQFANINGPNIQAISGDWLITECAEDRLKMFNDNNDYIVLERACN